MEERKVIASIRQTRLMSQDEFEEHMLKVEASRAAFRRKFSFAVGILTALILLSLWAL
jgi:hypothetical protein